MVHCRNKIENRTTEVCTHKQVYTDIHGYIVQVFWLLSRLKIIFKNDAIDTEKEDCPKKVTKPSDYIFFCLTLSKWRVISCNCVVFIRAREKGAYIVRMYDS